MEHPIYSYQFTEPTITEAPKLELFTYIMNYKGRTVMDRLFFIGTHSKFLSAEALQVASLEARRNRDVEAYRAITETRNRINDEGNKLYLDTNWIETTMKNNDIEMERLENDLKGYKNNLIKESIRMGHEALADHLYRTGALEESARAYNRMREYCTTASHVRQMLRKILVVAVDRRQWMDVQLTLTRLRSLDSKTPLTKLEHSAISAVQGLYYMCTGQYKQAASHFLSTEPILGTRFTEIITMNDVATYGTLCALATMERDELQSLILDNSSFRVFIETESHLRRVVKAFCSSKFRLCFETLEAYKGDYLLDIHLSPHVEKLYEVFRIKVMQNYILPFSVLGIDSLRSIFYGSSEPGDDETEKKEKEKENEDFKDELLQLINSGSLEARLDLEHDTLVRPGEDHRYSAYHGLLQDSKTFVESAHLELLHMNMIYADMEVRGTVGMEQRAELTGGPNGRTLDLA